MLTKRTNILFEQELWDKLSLLAKESDVSVGELIRRAVKERYFEDNRQEEIAKAIQRIRALRKPQKKNINYKELINYGRRF